MKKITLVIGVAAFTLFSCGNDEATSDTTNELAAPSSTDVSSVNNAEISTEGSGEPNLSDLANGTASLPAETKTETTAPSSVNNVRLNPPHGEPGHVCEIPVGQPLTQGGGSATPTISKQPAAQAAPQVQVAPPTAAPAVPTNSSGSNSTRLNPPHGEPGHVCEVAVGAPLP